ncbi:MAG: NADH-quinone oxidoreductase subunit J [Deltaproteobacteria bacterium]|nr:NADH-quinone oxidoreductase subunit J [Deltaproteobacteria bacterium]
MLPLVPVVVCCALAALTGIGVIALRRPVYVAVALLGHSLSLAALYLAMSAQFSAAAQTLIYSGAIVVLFLIVVALLPSGGAEQTSWPRMAAGAVVLVAMLAGLATAVLASGLAHANREVFSVEQVGAPLFAELLLPFELTAPLLLAAIVAAIALWRRQESRPTADDEGARP